MTCWTFGISFLLRPLGLKATDWALGRRVWAWAGEAESQKEKELQQACVPRKAEGLQPLPVSVLEMSWLTPTDVIYS